LLPSSRAHAAAANRLRARQAFWLCLKLRAV